MSHKSRLPLTVIKVGGSLFDLPDLPRRLDDLLAIPGQKVLLFGGGEEVDGLRQQSMAGKWSDADAHWEAIRLMSRSAETQSRLWPDGDIIHSFDELDEPDDRLVIFDAANELLKDAGHSLPIGWHITSDSIAAWLTLKSEAKELILVKSVGDDAPFTIEQAASHGWLDAYFPIIARKLVESGTRISWINARGSSMNRFPLCF